MNAFFPSHAVGALSPTASFYLRQVVGNGTPSGDGEGLFSGQL